MPVVKVFDAEGRPCLRRGVDAREIVAQGGSWDAPGKPKSDKQAALNEKLSRTKGELEKEAAELIPPADAQKMSKAELAETLVDTVSTTPVRCAFINLTSGKQCKTDAVQGSDYCWRPQHKGE